MHVKIWSKLLVERERREEVKSVWSHKTRVETMLPELERLWESILEESLGWFEVSLVFKFGIKA